MSESQLSRYSKLDATVDGVVALLTRDQLIFTLAEGNELSWVDALLCQVLANRCGAACRQVQIIGRVALAIRMT